MPTNVTYPGVYINEIPSGSHPITGVTTSRTAFVGRAKWGPVNDPIIINSYHEFVSVFGGLWRKSSLGYSVSDFFNNGGSQAVIVRLYKESTEEDSPPAKAQIDIGDFCFEAANPGEWGESLIIEIDFDIPEKSAEQLKLDINNMFNLQVAKRDEKGKIIRSERYENLSIDDKDKEDNHNRQRYDLLLGMHSALIHHKDGKDLPADLNSTKELLKDGVVKYSAQETIDEIQKKLDDLNEDKEDEKAKLKEMIISLKSSDGEQLDADCFVGSDNKENNKGIYAIEHIAPIVFNLLVIPPYNPDDVDPEVIQKAAEYCEKKKAFMILDPPSTWETVQDVENGLNSIGTNSKNAAIYFPRVKVPDLLDNLQLKEVGPSGSIAGVYARTDLGRGVWKAPAGIDALLQVTEISTILSDDDNGLLNPLGINCLRQFPVNGNVIWGARTLQGADLLNSEWKYVNVRRLALYIEQSLEQGIKWAVFEPNDRPLWNQLRISISNFLSGLFTDGAFVGSKMEDAFFVTVDESTTTQSDIDQGIVNIEIGFAPLKPAEFIIIRIQQTAGQAS